MSLIPTTSAQADGYDRLPSSLPDDNYKLYRDGVPVGSSLECFENEVGLCTTGGYGAGGSHQYLTLSRGSINDDRSAPRPGYPGYIISLEIFTTTLSNKTLSLSLVDRGIDKFDPGRSCSGYNINVVYKSGVGSLVNTSSGSSTYTIDNGNYVNGCNKTYTMPSYPLAGFKELKDQYAQSFSPKLYHGFIDFVLPISTPQEKQASFHITTSGARLGYKAANEGPDSNPGTSLSGWVNTYPTNAADGHKIQFKFAPPCDTTDGTPFKIGWDDVNEGTQYQQTNAVMRVYKQHRDGSGTEDVLPYQDAGAKYGDWQLTTSSYETGKPYVYIVEFSDVDGGNGISFRYPFSSANYYLDCPSPPPPTSWKLDPGTAVRSQVDAYTPRWVNANTDAKQGDNVARAKTAFSAVRFKHYVDEIDGKRAAQDGEHRWTIQFKTIRAGGAESAIFDKPSPLNNLSVFVPAGGNGILENDSRPNINSEGMKFLFRNAADTEYRNPVLGDQYCERVNNNTGSNVNGVVVNDPSSWKCVALTNNPPCEEWSVRGISSVTGDGDPNDAWVGQNYNYNYNFSNNGPADNTAAIYFYHNFTPVPGPYPYAGYIHTQTLGSWTPSYGVNIAASHGGTTLTDQMIYTPTTSAGTDNCGIFGSATLSNSVTVPYYYHLKATSDGVASTTQQGDTIKPTFKVNLPERDNQDLENSTSDNEYDGRPHTYSADTSWRIIEFRASDANDAKAKIPRNTSTDGAGDCAEMTGFGIVGFSTANCGVVGSGHQVFTIGSVDFSPYTRPALPLEPVGTVICYVGVVGKPTHHTEAEWPAWRYSNVSCTTVVKSPKVQFLNGDLTVGRYRGPAPCTLPDAATPSSIRTSGVPGGFGALSLPGSPNLYGSWVEYGAFAPGTFLNFGTAAYGKYSASPSAEEKLMFGNNPTKGGYAYGNNCISNPFSMINPSNVNDLPPGQADNLHLNQYFTNPAHDTPAEDKTGYVSDQRDITISPPPGPAAYKAIVTIKAGAENPHVGPDAACPNMKVTLKEGDGTPSVWDAAVCDNSAGGAPLGTYTHEFDLGSQGYKGPQGLNIIYTNDHCCSGGDRNLYIGQITVEFTANGSVATINPFDVDPAKNRRLFNHSAAYTVPSVGGGGVIGGVGGEPEPEPEVSSDGSACYDSSQSTPGGSRLWVPQSLASSSTGGRWCYGYNLEAPDLVGIMPVVPPAGGLDDNFNAFKGRDIVLYAQKGPGVCGDSGVNGNIVINTDINYAKAGYGDIRELPRVVLLADCKIIIDDAVKRVDAWLIAKDAVQTCGASTGELFRTNSVNQDTCQEQLKVNGPVQAKRLLLWRTHGADLTVGASRSEPGEVFDLRPDQILATYAQGQDAGNPQTVYQTDLPPRY